MIRVRSESLVDLYKVSSGPTESRLFRAKTIALNALLAEPLPSRNASVTLSVTDQSKQEISVEEGLKEKVGEEVAVWVDEAVDVAVAAASRDWRFRVANALLFKVKNLKIFILTIVAQIQNLFSKVPKQDVVKTNGRVAYAFVKSLKSAEKSVSADASNRSLELLRGMEGFENVESFDVAKEKLADALKEARDKAFDVGFDDENLKHLIPIRFIRKGVRALVRFGGRWKTDRLIDKNLDDPLRLVQIMLGGKGEVKEKKGLLAKLFENREKEKAHELAKLLGVPEETFDDVIGDLNEHPELLYPLLTNIVNENVALLERSAGLETIPDRAIKTTLSEDSLESVAGRVTTIAMEKVLTPKISAFSASSQVDVTNLLSKTESLIKKGVKVSFKPSVPETEEDGQLRAFTKQIFPVVKKELLKSKDELELGDVELEFQLYQAASFVKAVVEDIDANKVLEEILGKQESSLSSSEEVGGVEAWIKELTEMLVDGEMIGSLGRKAGQPGVELVAGVASKIIPYFINPEKLLLQTVNNAHKVASGLEIAELAEANREELGSFLERLQKAEEALPKGEEGDINLLMEKMSEKVAGSMKLTDPDHPTIQKLAVTITDNTFALLFPNGHEDLSLRFGAEKAYELMKKEAVKALAKEIVTPTPLHILLPKILNPIIGIIHPNPESRVKLVMAATQGGGEEKKNAGEMAELMARQWGMKDADIDRIKKYQDSPEVFLPLLQKLVERNFQVIREAQKKGVDAPKKFAKSPIAEEKAGRSKLLGTIDQNIQQQVLGVLAGTSEEFRQKASGFHGRTVGLVEVVTRPMRKAYRSRLEKTKAKKEGLPSTLKPAGDRLVGALVRKLDILGQPVEAIRELVEIPVMQTLDIAAKSAERVDPATLVRSNLDLVNDFFRELRGFKEKISKELTDKERSDLLVKLMAPPVPLKEGAPPVFISDPEEILSLATLSTLKEGADALTSTFIPGKEVSGDVLKSTEKLLVESVMGMAQQFVKHHRAPVEPLLRELMVQYAVKQECKEKLDEKKMLGSKIKKLSNKPLKKAELVAEQLILDKEIAEASLKIRRRIVERDLSDLTQEGKRKQLESLLVKVIDPPFGTKNLVRDAVKGMANLLFDEPVLNILLARIAANTMKEIANPSHLKEGYVPPKELLPPKLVHNAFGYVMESSKLGSFLNNRFGGVVQGFVDGTVKKKIIVPGGVLGVIERGIDRWVEKQG